jgi:cellulose synthase/poly-beta-1,6-N-acetylglucosamine synthase-like glycosyltransferase
MDIVVLIAVVGLGLPVYSYVGYPLLLFLVASFVQSGRDAYFLVTRRDRRTHAEVLPRVSILIAAHNEEAVIGRTLERCLELDYPAELLQVVLGSDGSTDKTVLIASRYQDRRLTVRDFLQRRGKLAVLNECVRVAIGDVLIFSDANTLLAADAVRRLVRHFGDPRVGAVCGELRLADPDGAAVHEGAYWRYEVILKMLESRVDCPLGANGALYAVRKELLPGLDADVITEDFVIPMKVRAQGSRVVYDPEAVATETVSPGTAGEFRRRVRIGAGDWQALAECRSFLNPARGFVSVAFWSHKVLRWFTPFLLGAGLVATLALSYSAFWRGVFAVQVAFYLCALVGGAAALLRLPAGPLRIPYYFVAINAALAVGMVKGLLHLQEPAWQRTSRDTAATGDRP